MHLFIPLHQNKILVIFPGCRVTVKAPLSWQALDAIYKMNKINFENCREVKYGWQQC